MQGQQYKRILPHSSNCSIVWNDRHWYVGDPDWVKVPVDKLLSKDYAAAQRKRIDMNKAQTWPIQGGLEPFSKNTTTILVKDASGNAMSITTSIGLNWVVMGDTGIVINNRMTMYDFDDRLPNQVQPGKKIRHTSNPCMAFKDGRLFMLWACSGVDTQPQVQVQAFINVVDFGMNPLEAVSAGRYIQHSFPVTGVRRPRDLLAVEKDKTSPEMIDSLKKKGHNVGFNAIFGNMNMVLVDQKTGALMAGTDPRQEGYAAGW